MKEPNQPIWLPARKSVQVPVLPKIGSLGS
jgi:hypothetical protein